MLTKSEHQIMELLWAVDTPLTASEIVKLSAEKTWKSSYIHLLVNSLLKKKMIEPVGMKQMKKNYARTFRPNISKEEYAAIALHEQKDITPKSLPYLVSTLLEETHDEQLISELENIIQKRKDRLK